MKLFIKRHSIFLILCLTLLIPILDLLHAGFPITHDGQDHIARIANFYKNLQEGIIIPRWAPNLNWGFGHPILMFLYPLPSYIASFFHFLNFGLIDSTKITFALGMFLSGITMYLWLSSFWNKTSSLIGALLYVFAPYRFVELYVRGDIGENLAFIFIPLVLFFIQKLSHKPSTQWVIGGSVSIAMLILSHNAISLMFMPFILIYIFYKAAFYSKMKKSFLIQSGVMLLLGFGLAAFFWIPGLMEGKYTLRDIVTKGEYKKRFVGFSQFFYGPWSYGGSGEFTVQFGILQWFFLITSIVSLPYVWIKKREKISFAILLLVYTTIGVIIMLPVSSLVWEKLTILQDFQFPWRFLAIIVFTTAVLGGYISEIFKDKMNRVIVVLLILILLFLSKEYWHAKLYKVVPETFFTNIYNGTTDTGESSPIWSVRFMEKQASSPISIIQGLGKLTLIEKKVTLHEYRATIETPMARIVENTLYFPGWRVLVDGKPVSIQFQDPSNRGLITFFVSKGPHIIVVEFLDTKIRRISEIVSLISVIIVGILLVIAFKKRQL